MTKIKSLSAPSVKRIRDRQPNGDPNQVDVHIGKRIRHRRQLLHWSQSKMGDMLGLTFQQIQKYETGANRVSGSRLYDFAVILGVGVEYFYQDMPIEIQKQSSRHIIIGENSSKSATELLFLQTADPMQSDIAVELVKNFLRISNRKVADEMFELIKTLSKSDWRLNKENMADNS